jgi:hypothetical protein
MMDAKKQEPQANATINRDMRVSARFDEPVAMLPMSNKRNSGTTSASEKLTRETGLKMKYTMYLRRMLQKIQREKGELHHNSEAALTAVCSRQLWTRAAASTSAFSFCSVQYHVIAPEKHAAVIKHRYRSTRPRLRAPVLEVPES